MNLNSNDKRISRSRPLLGTFVTISIESSHAEPEVHAAISEAFESIAHVEKVMTIYEPSSELSQLNLNAHQQRIVLSGDLNLVFEFSLSLFRLTEGRFDVVSAGGCSGDIVFENGAIYFNKPLTIDLGGIAKGFAVDRAVEVLEGRGMPKGSVSAGGDIRVFGESSPTFFLDHDQPEFLAWTPGYCAVATSIVGPNRSYRYTRSRYRNLHQTDLAQAVSVASNSCMIADALTKVVLTLDDAAAPILEELKAVMVITT